MRPGPDAPTVIVIDVLSSLAFNTEEEERDACGQLLKEKWRGGDIERDKKNTKIEEKRKIEWEKGIG